jgi:hypothetical protein
MDIKEKRLYGNAVADCQNVRHSGGHSLSLSQRSYDKVTLRNYVQISSILAYYDDGRNMNSRTHCRSVDRDRSTKCPDSPSPRKDLIRTPLFRRNMERSSRGAIC